MRWFTYIFPRSIPGFGAGSGISVEFKDLSFHVKAVGDLSDDDRDRVGNTQTDIVP